VHTGFYKGYVYAVDRSGLQSLPQTFTLTQYAGTPVMRGDLNLDGVVDLTDVLSALKAVDGIFINGLWLNLEVSKDGAIGLEEAVFALRKAAGL
jgi:hypothetical protein